MDSTRETKRAERRRHEVPSVAIVGYTNAGQVQPAQPADRRRCPGRGRPLRHPRSDDPAARRPPTAGSTPSPTRSASSGTCRTTWSRPSPRPWRSRRGPTCWSTSSTAPMPIPAGQISAVRAVLADIGAGRRARTDRAQQGRPGRPPTLSPCCAPAIPARWSSRRAPAPASTISGPRSRPGCRDPRSQMRALDSRTQRGDLINRIHQSGEFLSQRAHRGRHAGRRPGESVARRRAGAVRARRHASLIGDSAITVQR